MKYLFVIFIICANKLLFSQDNLMEKAKLFKKHELSVAFHYAQHKYGDNPLLQIRIFNSNGTELLDYQDVGKKIGRGIGLRAQYNYFFKKKIFMSSSVNLFFYAPGIIEFDWTKNSKTFPKDEYHPILSFSRDKGKMSYSANQTYIDVGVGFVPISKNKFNWRLGFGLGIGYHYYSDPVVFWSYDYVYVPEKNETYLNFHGFTPFVLNSILFGGFVETAFNYEIIKDKLSFGINYKFLMTKKYYEDGVYPQNVGFITNIKF